MRRCPRRLNLLLLLLFAPQAHASVQLVVDGVADPPKAAAIAGVELSQYATRDVSDAQARRLYEGAPGQVKSALEPYGYYDATVTGDLQPVGKDWRVTLHVQPGEPGDMQSPLGMHRSSRRCRQHHEMPRPSMPVIAASKPASAAKRRPRSA
ncbi:hypothetical protein RHOFW510R12_10460 [Rhodanobacter sp. FW510-R12]|uniref:POTRA domain-containing protein n=1 Tax=unclassified Rhodanobacter TaxID=2621553 RepID=UPI0007AA0836|nr:MULTISPECIES: POTRA domain-containing protein [unclassified Rhodanobacter]KZC15792.1 hypothetical protein RHOFW104R8_03065 [Rhodanobacter sp. FW104-R8]KZC26100.1 hypothetical protein RhoFW510T8_04015 [Rhodanobacter sp. FW510-T8]KZC30360.1 hypothetical protein RhoFW510R10_02535 [Rhodanobacter sp. FW510-R10]